jgi:hypothetical protein
LDEAGGLSHYSIAPACGAWCAETGAKGVP